MASVQLQGKIMNHPGYLPETSLAAGLQTPHPDIAKLDPAIEAAPLIGAQPFRSVVAALRADPNTYDHTVEAAMGIGGVVRRTLRFGSYTDGIRLLTSEELPLTQRTNCYGYTAVYSECLELAGINHHVAFANDHAFVLIEDEARGKMTLIDPVSPKFNGDVTKAWGGESPERQFRNHTDRAANFLDTQVMLAQAGITESIDEVSQTSPWLVMGGETMRGGVYDETREAMRYVLRVQSYRPSLGRAVLTYYANAAILASTGKSVAAADKIAALQGVYPDIDSRRSAVLARMVTGDLMRQKRWGSALMVGKAVAASLTEADWSVNRYFYPDLMRKVGNATQNRDLIGLALNEYGDMPGSKLRDGKIRAAQKKMAEIRE